MEAVEDAVSVLWGSGGGFSAETSFVFFRVGSSGGFSSELQSALRDGKLALARRGMTGSGSGLICGKET